ncbi:uncharacterized protein LOC122069513 [Macadamia integrifolia]|uniref:uncharacterized protein LOC122069513 n=1 Tax=Macadamia integrifolia TaxID=60698 RepID=UPI001C4FCC0A|nr:uncharacterized protein LOC122069513 [Macadamia integrifolia]
MPAASCGESSLMYNLLEEALNESFETIYFVDQNTIPSSSMLDEARWRSAKDVWVNWKNPNHWFRTKIISPVLINSRLLIKKSEEESESEILNHVLGFLECPINAAKEIFGHNFDELAMQSLLPTSLAEQHMSLIAIEFSIICKFIREQQNFGSVKDLFDFMEDCFAKMLYFTLHRLPMAIVKEIEGENGKEISEGRVRKIMKFLCKLELLWDTIEWSWPPKLDPKSHQANDAQSTTIGQAEPPSQTSNTTTTTTADDGDDDTIREIGSDEIV